MNANLTRLLVQRHPALLAMPNRSVIAQRGVECGDGWHDIIDEMLTAIENHCSAAGAAPPAVLQIKEKFGLLRVYLTPSNDAIRAIVDAAEQKSATWCGRCGRAGKFVTTPFPQIRCKACRYSAFAPLTSA